jgi:phytoene desaturase
MLSEIKVDAPDCPLWRSFEVFCTDASCAAGGSGYELGMVATSHVQPGRRVVVIGSGFGGLAAAIRLQARGYSVTILEMRDKPGGRAYVYEDKGFTYDAGPTIVTVPFVLEELATVAGKKLEDYVKIVPCDPFYRIYFHDKRVFDYRGDQASLEAEIAKFNPADVEGYRKFLDYSRRVFDRAFTDLAAHSFHSIWEMVKVAPDLIRLRAERSVFSRVSDFIQDPCLRQVFTFEPLLIGGSPLKSSSIYSMIHYLEKTWGVHFAMGGTGALVRGLVKLFEDIGGKIELGARVSSIDVVAGKVRSVKTADGRSFDADVVVSNGDVANTYRKLIAPEHRRKWTDRRLERMRYAMSLFVIYFGTNRTYEHLPHHSIVLGPRYEGLLKDIFDRKVVAEDFSLYLHAPTRTDPSLAPPGCECFYVLSPVPHLGGGQDWDKIKEEYADRILASLEKDHLVPGLRKHLVSKLIFTPKNFETDLDAYLGSAFQFEPILTQSAWFRPHNKSEDVEGLYFVGAGTHPGAGLPGVISSAKVLERWL